MESDFNNVKSIQTVRFLVELQKNEKTDQYRVRYYNGKVEELIPAVDLKNAMDLYDEVIIGAEGH